MVDEADGADDDVEALDVTAHHPGDLLGTWRVATLDGRAVDEGRSRPELTFEGDGTLYGSGGVNSLRGTWAVRVDRLETGPIVTTLMAGLPEHMDTERRLLAALAAGPRLTRGGAALVLEATGSSDEVGLERAMRAV